MPFFLPTIYSQDTLKSTLFVPDIPVGRVEEFYDFGTEPAEKEKDKNQVIKPSVIKKITVENEKPKAKPKAQEQTPIKTISAKTIENQIKEENNEAVNVTDSVPVKIEGSNFTSLHFYDSIKSDWSQIYKTEVRETTIQRSTSLFTGHALQAKSQEPIFIKKNQDGMIGAFLIILGLFALVKVVYYKQFKKYFISFFNLRFNIQMLQKEKAVSEQIYSIMLVASLLITTTFLYQIIEHYGLNIKISFSFFSDYLYLKILALVLGSFLLKIFIVKISGFIFNSNKITSGYIFNMILFFNILNIILLPIVIGIQYANLIPVQFLFITGTVIIGLTFCFLLQRLYILGNSEQGTSSYYIFLYLCALEIIPIILMFKFLSFRLELI
ncbi:MAG: DUF4271 domain-containing protein [Bacteroidetes bacterium]|nr:DUF4271 domain-containing protein [Bacteroidota bacterium]HET6244725.1 DUF4271 domain-containing protein [Bacteroidia bacterium]